MQNLMIKTLLDKITAVETARGKPIGDISPTLDFDIDYAISTGRPALINAMLKILDLEHYTEFGTPVKSCGCGHKH